MNMFKNTYIDLFCLDFLNKTILFHHSKWHYSCLLKFPQIIMKMKIQIVIKNHSVAVKQIINDLILDSAVRGEAYLSI